MKKKKIKIKLGKIQECIETILKRKSDLFRHLKRQFITHRLQNGTMASNTGIENINQLLLENIGDFLDSEAVKYEEQINHITNSETLHIEMAAAAMEVYIREVDMKNYSFSDKMINMLGSNYLFQNIS